MIDDEKFRFRDPGRHLTPFATIALKLGLSEQVAVKTCRRALQKLARKPGAIDALRYLAALAEKQRAGQRDWEAQ